MSLHAALANDEYKDIPEVLVNGWPSSWKKILFSLMYYNNWYLLYPGYEQVGFITAAACGAMVEFLSFGDSGDGES